MAKSLPGMLEEFGGHVEAVAGREAAEMVMAGAGSITPKSRGIDAAHWMSGALARLSEATSPERSVQVMERCGANCARLNHGVIDRARARRQKYRTEEEFLAAEIKKPSTGTRLELRDGVLVQFYTPQAFSHPMRCYCGLVKELPAGETISLTYCHCSKAFVRTLWQEALGRPVTVELVQSALSGAAECEFRIYL